jgi:hypothetical protein
LKRFAKIFAVLALVAVAFLVARRQTRDLRGISWEELRGRRGIAAAENLLRLLPATLPGRGWLDQQLQEMGTCTSSTPLPFASRLTFNAARKEDFLSVSCADKLGGQFQLFMSSNTTFRLDREAGQPIVLSLSDGRIHVNLTKGAFRFYVNTGQITLGTTGKRPCGIMISTSAGAAQLAVSPCELKVDIPTATLGNVKTTPLTIVPAVGAEVELPGLSLKNGEAAVLAPSGLRKVSMPEAPAQ